MTNPISEAETAPGGLPPFHGDRFGGIGRLYGQAAMERLWSASVTVVGIGGVGSWAVEALARSGIGRITLVDFDEVCVTNVNRQLHALEGTLGRSKVAVMAERVASISPYCEVFGVERFFTPATADEVLAAGGCNGPRAVIDAIDTVKDKALLLAECHRRGLPVVTCGAAGGKRDLTRIQVADLAVATHDRLLKQVRKILRREHFPDLAEGCRFGIPAVYAAEHSVFPGADGTVCVDRGPGHPSRLNCDSGLGTVTHVTGAFGFAATGEVIRLLLAGKPE